MEMSFSAIDAAIELNLEVSRPNNVTIGIGTSNPGELKQRLAQGFRFMVYGTDYLLLLGEVRQGVESFQGSTPE